MMFLVNIFEAILVALQQMPITLLMVLIAVVGGIIFGLIVALIRYYKVALISPLLSIGVNVFKAIPLVVLLMIGYFTMLPLIPPINIYVPGAYPKHSITRFLVAVTCLTIHSVVESSEIFRGSLYSINKNQFDASKACGFNTFQMLRNIIIPQVFRNSKPMLYTMIINAIKGSSLASFISLIEITGATNIWAAVGYNYFEANLGAAFVYWALSILVLSMINKNHKQMKKV